MIRTLAATLAATGLSLVLSGSLYAQTGNAPQGQAPTGAASEGNSPGAGPMPAVFKMGYTNVNYILSASPQTRVIRTQLENASKQYEKAISDKMKEFEDKYAAYQRTEATMMESIKADKQNELRTLEQSIRTLQESAQGDLKNREQELVRPELDKIYAAINAVARDNQYTYVLNSDQVVLYAAEGADISKLVLQKLGYPEPGDEPETGTQARQQRQGSGGAASPAAGTARPSGSGSGAGQPAAPRPRGRK